ncbi:hypothetical protein ZWY2020_019320 [Hordeum vulgare]|nr:hypothetical protein ZWY2020_019320 [Hordeum vulgare]
MTTHPRPQTANRSSRAAARRRSPPSPAPLGAAATPAPPPCPLPSRRPSSPLRPLPPRRPSASGQPPPLPSSLLTVTDLLLLQRCRGRNARVMETQQKSPRANNHEVKEHSKRTQSSKLGRCTWKRHARVYGCRNFWRGRRGRQHQAQQGALFQAQFEDDGGEEGSTSATRHLKVHGKVSSILQDYDVRPLGKGICLEELKCRSYDCRVPDSLLHRRGDTDSTKTTTGSPTQDVKAKKVVSRKPRRAKDLWYARELFIPIWRSVLSARFITRFGPQRRLLLVLIGLVPKCSRQSLRRSSSGRSRTRGRAISGGGAGLGGRTGSR